MYFLTLLVVCIAGFLDNANSVELPPQTCSEYFQYLTNSSGHFMGKITLTDLPNEMIIVQLRLSQHEFIKNNIIGNITNWDDLDTNLKNLEENKPVKFRVIFSNQKELPKVTRISVNRIKLCSADDYPEPRVNIVLNIWLTPTNATVHEGDVGALPEGFVKKFDTREDE